MINIVPAIDIIGGKCVRLEKGEYSSKKIYSEDPLEMAKTFESWGIRNLHLVDLDGAKEGRPVNLGILEKISNRTKLIIDFGGGIRSDKDIELAFECGASMVSGGSIAHKNPEVFLNWLNIFGPDKIILGADHKNEKISLSGWLEESNTSLFSYLENYIQKGIRQVICTDIDKDGMLQGPSLELYKGILLKWPGLHLVASGGVSKMKDILELEKAAVPSVIVGKAIYENRISPKEIRDFLAGKMNEIQ
ncbi:MAG: 1-(5-phosphoribosyl)-5-[(5-phosphoribosylamino)methylideneamino]imidazole-4-carboxamide isomerase [Bacteroidales bacterium]|nr:1-(5-phosphoribosyl)-5-[(5-phosphoribosylamino)methylideneamino]imidazole-4-carboxamide isomerase [Bacteroidales bacterium]